MPDFRIYPATLDDIPLIRRMAGEVFPATYSAILPPAQVDYMMDWMYSESGLAEQVEGNGRFFFLAEVDGSPAGYLSLEYESTLEDGRKQYHLQKLYVLPEFQGKGAGRRMFEFAVGFLTSWNPDGCRMELNVNRSNSAVTFYEHMGMKRDRQGDFPIGKGYYMNDYIYALDI